jgi:hypothetical protein
MDKLRLKFGSEFEIHMMHNVYCIKAPGLLTAVSSMILVHAHSRRV